MLAWLVVPAQAQVGDGSGEAEPFDMETDADSNGIPDDFENGFNRIMAVAEGPSGTSADRQDAVLRAINEFAARVPMHPRTHRLQAHINTYHEVMMQDITDRRHQVIADKIARLEQRIRDTDPVYVATMQYLETLNADALTADAGVQRESHRRVRDYENRIHRVGDILYRRQPAGTSKLSWLWAMRWDHVGMYAGPGMVYDSDTGDPCEGVTIRPSSSFFENNNEIQLGELRNSRGRGFVPNALNAAKKKYGTGCVTKYQYNFLLRRSTDHLYCSQLVWRTYKDMLGSYSVNLDSNHWRYFTWLTLNYGAAIATSVGPTAIAPDEIALDQDIRNYWKGRVNIH